LSGKETFVDVKIGKNVRDSNGEDRGVRGHTSNNPEHPPDLTVDGKEAIFTRPEKDG